MLKHDPTITSFPIRLKVAHIPSGPSLLRMKQSGLCFAPAPTKGTLEMLAGPAKPRPPQSFPMTKTAFAVSSGKDKKNTLYYFGLAKDLKFWCLFLPSGVATQLKEVFDLQTHTLTGERTIC